MDGVDYVVPRAEDILRLPEGDQAPLKRMVLAEYLANPFLDEDAAALSVRIGRDAAEVEVVLEALCRQGVLQETAGRARILAPVDPEGLVAVSGSDTEAGTDPPAVDGAQAVRVIEQFLQTRDPSLAAAAETALEQLKSLLGHSGIDGLDGDADAGSSA